MNTADLLEPITRCEVCGNQSLLPLLDLGAQPLCDDLLPIGSSETCKRYPVELLGCSQCITVHQKYQVKKAVLFSENYHYRAALTKDVLDGMAELVAIAQREADGDLNGKWVLDIGCNDGSLLAQMRTKGATTVGIEPTGAAEDAITRVDHVLKRFFDKDAVAAYLERFPKPDFITFTNVFAHISDLNAVVADLKALIGPNTLLIIENHYLGSVIDRAQFDTFYHEHPRTYSQRSFEVIAERLGLGLVAVDYPKRYNGNIRIVMAAGGKGVPASTNESGFLEALAPMSGQVEAARQRFIDRVAPLVKKYGPLPAKAFPGRASMIITSFGIDESILAAAYEKPNSKKIGHLIPGTRIPILDETQFFAAPTAPVMINLAWHIADEIVPYVRSKGFDGQIINTYGD